MSKALSIAGEKYGRLRAIEPLRTSPQGVVWKFICECGRETTAPAKAVKHGGIRSCGCLARETWAKRCKSLNKTHGMTDTPTFRSWTAMRVRCRNPKAPNYYKYGGVGIDFCQRWDSFENFLADMGERPLGTSLDRFPDPAGNYGPDNCRWATPVQQRHNRAHRKTVGELFERGLVRPA